MSENPTTHFGYQEIPTSLKTERVAGVFHSVAKRYNLMNDLMSFGLHRFWKSIAISRCSIRPHHQVLDLACGTGDLSLAFAKKINNPGKVVLSDINSAMLALCKERLLNEGITEGVEFVQANAEALPFPSEHFDCIAIAFGLRNVTHQDKALSEMTRLLKPGGRVIILEFSHPEHGFLNTIYDAYSFSVLPTLGKIICNDSQSYQYLAESIRMHPKQDTLKNMMEAAGLQQVQYQNIHQGIVALHQGFKF